MTAVAVTSIIMEPATLKARIADVSIRGLISSVGSLGISKAGAIADPTQPFTIPGNPWMEVILRNNTQFPIIPRMHKPVSGHIVPGFGLHVTDPFSVSQFVAQIDGGAGSTSGMLFSMVLDLTAVTMEISVVWCKKSAGVYKAAVVECDDPTNAFTYATSEGTAGVASGEYSGKDETDQPTMFVIVMSAEVSPNKVVVTMRQNLF